MKGAAEALWFRFFSPSFSGWRNAKRCAFWHHLRLALVWYYPQFTVQRCSLIQTDSLVAPTQFICYNRRGRRFIIIWLLTIAYTVISQMDGSRCCAGSASVTLHTLPEPRKKLPNHSCDAVRHCLPPPHPLPQGVLCICSTNVSPVGIVIKANIMASYCTVHSRQLLPTSSQHAGLWETGNLHLRSDGIQFFAALHCFNATTWHRSLSLMWLCVC